MFLKRFKETVLQPVCSFHLFLVSYVPQCEFSVLRCHVIVRCVLMCVRTPSSSCNSSKLLSLKNNLSSVLWQPQSENQHDTGRALKTCLSVKTWQFFLVGWKWNIQPFLNVPAFVNKDRHMEEEVAAWMSAGCIESPKISAVIPRGKVTTRLSRYIWRCLLVYGVIPVVCRRLPRGFMQVFKVCDEFEPIRRNLCLSRVDVATITFHIKTNCVIITVLSCEYICDAYEPIFHIKVKLTARTSSGRRRMCCHGHRPSQHRECGPDLCVIRAAVRV